MLKYFVKLVVLIVAVGAGRFAFEKVANLPLFALEEVEINTNGYFDPDTLVVLSGLEKGKSIFKQDIKFAADMIARQKGVVSCVVDRGIFSDIIVNVEFAEPNLLINGDKVFGLSKEGIVLPVNDLTPDLPLPLPAPTSNVVPAPSLLTPAPPTVPTVTRVLPAPLTWVNL